ncbi:MAG: hypothetical protein AAGJ69_12110, partial [Cyanobacteria bacterium J06559_1]
PKVLQTLSIRDSLVFAYEQYQPKSLFVGHLLLVRATVGDGSTADLPYVEEYADPLLGWAPFCKQPIETFDAPGGHSSMLNDENVVSLAAAVDRAIADFVSYGTAPQTATKKGSQRAIAP